MLSLLLFESHNDHSSNTVCCLLVRLFVRPSVVADVATVVVAVVAAVALAADVAVAAGVILHSLLVLFFMHCCWCYFAFKFGQ